MDSTAPRLKTKSVGIIGAGISGLSCAKTLTQAGFIVELFDKGRNLSGRMATSRNDDSEFDHGAQYFTATHPEFKKEVAKWVDVGIAQLWTPDISVFGDKQFTKTTDQVERFVGIPSMTTPARFLSMGLSINLNTTIESICLSLIHI